MTRALLGTMVLASLLGGPANAQWVADASAGGTDHDAVAARAGTRNAVLGVRYQGARWGYLSAGAPLDSVGLPWAAVGVGGRATTRWWGVEVGADVSGEAHGYRARQLDATGGGLLLGFLPYLAWDGASARVEVGSGVRHFLSVFDGTTESRAVSVTALRATARALPAVLVEVGARYVRAEEGGYPYAGGAVDVSLGRTTIRAHAGRWLAEAHDGADWGATARLRVDDRTSLYTAFAQEAAEPLYWNDPRRSWTVGVSRALGSRGLPALEAVAPVAADGRVEIRVPADAAGEPLSVGGDFNGWRPVPMARDGDDWTLSLPLRPGVYRYAFRRADGSWFVPASVPGRIDDGFGGESAVLVVAPRGQG